MSDAGFLIDLLDALGASARSRQPEEQLAPLASSFRHLVDFQRASLLLPLEHSGDFRVVVDGGAAADPARLPAHSAFLVRARELRPFAVGSRSEVAGCRTSHDLMQSVGAASTLTLPLQMDDRLVGSLQFHAAGENAFADTDLRVLAAGSVLAALALEHAQARNRVARMRDEISRGVEELEISRARLAAELAALAEDRRTSSAAPPAPRRSPGRREPDLRTLAAIEREAIERVLAHTNGRVSGPRGAATILGLKPSTLDSRMKKLGVRRSRP